MTDHDLETTDQELIEFFSAFDEIHASDELKDATLAKVFSMMDTEEEQGDLDAPPTFTVIEGGRDASMTEDSPASSSNKELTTATDSADLYHPTLSVSTSNAAHKHRLRSKLRMRIAAAVAAVAIIGTAGGVAYAVPSNHVQITEGDTTVEMGVNIFGVTVATTANTDEGKAVLDAVDVRDKGFEDAFGAIIDRLTSRGEGDGSVHVHVEGGFGGDRLDRDAERIIADRGLERGKGGRAGAAPTGPGNSGNAEAVGNSAANAPATGGATGSGTGNAPATADKAAPRDQNIAPNTPSATPVEDTSTPTVNNSTRSTSQPFEVDTSPSMGEGPAQDSQYSQVSSPSTTHWNGSAQNSPTARTMTEEPVAVLSAQSDMSDEDLAMPTTQAQPTTTSFEEDLIDRSGSAQ